MKGFLLALQFMTRIPTPRLRTDAADFAAAIRWFPAVGLVVGFGVAATAWAGTRIDPWTGALAGLVMWVAITGALHLDGLADVADASGAVHQDRARLLTVLADPHVGSFGVVVLVLQLIAKLVLLHALITVAPIKWLILVPFAARIGPLVWTLWLPPLHEGLAARFRGGIGWVHVTAWAVPLAAACAVVPSLVVTPLLIAAWGWRVRTMLGGISGDGHGAGIELVESGLLVAVLIGTIL